MSEDRGFAGHGWLSVKEAAEVAGVSQGAVRYWIGCGRLQALVTDAGHQAVDAGELGQLMAARRAAAKVGINVSTLLQWTAEAAEA